MDDRLSLEGLMAQYELEPTLVDVYVEGEADRRVVDWFLSRYSATNVSVYSIDFIDIPDAVLERHGLNSGSNRSKVIALSAELYSHFENRVNVMCVVDRDFDDYVPKVSTVPLLSFTDGSSIETYAFNEICLTKFTSVVLGGFPLTPNELLNCLTEILRDLYAVRLANETLGWGMQFLPLKGYVSIVRSKVQFQKEGFLKAYLQKNRKWRDRELFKRTLDACTTKLSTDHTRTVRGHDISELLLLIIRKLSNDRKFGNAETLEGVLLGTVEAQDLSVQPLFRKILNMSNASHTPVPHTEA